MVPNGWNKLSLQDLVSINYGKSPKEIIDENGIYDIVGTGGITGSTNSYLHSGPSVIIGRKGTIDKPQFLEKPFWAIDTTFYCLPLDSKKLDMNWFYQLSQVIDWRRYNEASGVPSLSRGTIYSIKVPTPPIQEQQKIVKILTTWDKAIDTTELLIDNSKQHKKALMQQLLTGKKRLLDDEGKRFEGDWGKETLKILGKVFIGLVTTMTKSYVDDGIPLIRNSDIKPNHITKEKMLSLCEEFANKHENRKLREGDVVTVHTGEVGVSAVIDRELDGCIGFATLNTRPDIKKLNPHFLSWYFNSEYFINWCVSMSTGDGRQNLNLKDFVKAEIPLPSLNEQKKIVSVLTNADKEIELLEQQLADLKQEKKALMQQLLTGKKRVTVD